MWLINFLKKTNMKKLLIIIPIITLVLSACGAKLSDKEVKVIEDQSKDIVELETAYLNEYTYQLLDFNKDFKLQGDLPLGINIMPVIDNDEDGKLELYGIAKEKGNFIFSLSSDNDIRRFYSLEVLELSNKNPSLRAPITDDCIVFDDGCNTCAREPGSNITMCTEMYCEVYSAPYCIEYSVSSR